MSPVSADRSGAPPKTGFFCRIWQSLKRKLSRTKDTNPYTNHLPAASNEENEEEHGKSDDGMIHRLLKGANIGSKMRKYSVVAVNREHDHPAGESLWGKVLLFLKSLGTKKEKPHPSTTAPIANNRLRNDSIRSERLVDFQRLPNIGEYVY
ncbi:hypothetical protein QR680_010759 [Steinernema hermaphroditum]|uniref:Uncharacterized protein n=1 Tax=Steinernema hermaphroditum TaxID=289476 RepID=A0AA39IQ19_9BILA|nr:hypothetical protein QR680_010759 [Steinernema hermaphroditum]